MGVSDKTKRYLDMLEESFDRNNFCDFIKDLLNLENSDIVDGIDKRATSEQYKNYIESSSLYANYEDSRRRKIGVIIIKLQDNKNPANARTLQRNYIAHLLEGYDLDASLTAIYSNTDNTWRLSFVKKEIAIEVGKLKTKVSPAKRYSYLFGKDEPNHTAKEQLIDFIENNTKKYSIEELEEKFSVEKVTKDFFEKYKENYLKLKEKLEENEEFVNESKRCDFTSEEFTKKLMGQLVFLYFLQKKGWLGVKLVPNILSFEEYNGIYNQQDVLGKKVLEKYYINYDGQKKIKNGLLERYKENLQDIDILSTVFVGTKYDKEWGTGEKKFIRKIFDNCVNRNKNFFDDYLEPFFYDGLNHKRKNQYFSTFNCKIPFLNGGLFEPLDNYRWESANFNLSNDIFREILDFFDRYNFTMNEEEPLEKDVAVDPEMLGKIFENLLDVKDRKSKGAFYTPREIVHYMCQESLANYLVNKVGVNYNEIKEFIQYGEMIRDVDLKEATRTDYLVGESIFNNISKIDKALENIKIADPAVGSGAFPLGMLNEIVKLRDILTSYMLIYNRLELFDRIYPEEMIVNKRNIYTIKWNTIKNCIYAVDIENSAVDITKLRLWLSIVVDQTEVLKSGPEPLPNLDCKIMQGNSLVDEYNGIKLIDEKFIEEFKNKENVRFNDGAKDKRGRYLIPQNQIQFGDGQKKVQIDDLISFKQELYGTNDSNRKNELLEKIQNARKELLKLNFIGTNKFEELLTVDSSHNKPYFAWMLEFIEVFIENEGFDIVIGNPPYVDSEHMVKDNNLMKTREFCNKNFKSAKGNWDLFIVFVELGYKHLNKMGNVSFIIPNKIIASNYAKEIRRIMAKKSLIEIRDYSNVNVFKEAAVYPITFISNNFESSFNYNVKMNKMKSKTEIEWENFVEYNEFKESTNWDNYFAKNNKANEIIKKINCNIKLDKIATVKGAATVSEAYIVKEKLINNDNLNMENYLKFVNTGTIDRYATTWESGKTQYIKQAYYSPVILKDDLKEILEKRYNESIQDKIIIGGMTKMLECYLDNGNCLAGKSTVIVYDCKLDLKYVIGILNSKLMTRFYQIYFNSLSLAGGFYRIGAPQIKELPIAIANEEKQKKLIGLVEQKNENPYNEEIDREIDTLVYSIYELSNEEIEILLEE